MSIMKSGIRKRFRIALAAVLLAAMAGVGYLVLVRYYQRGFGINTWINGIYCTGMTIEEVNAELLSRTEAPILTLRDEEGVSEEIDLSECGYQEDYTKALRDFMDRQNSFSWPSAFSQKRTLEIEKPDIRLDESLLRKAWEESAFVTREKSGETGVRLEKTLQGYELLDFTGHHLDVEAGYQKLRQTVLQGLDEITLDESCYVNLPYGTEEEPILELWKKIEVYQGCCITYDMGAEQILLDASKLSGFLTVDGDGLPVLGEDGKFQIDEEKAEAFITGLLEEYNTMKKDREFQSTRGDLVTVPAGTYGTELDDEEERAYFRDALQRCAESDRSFRETHVPAYKKEAYGRGKNDIGDTYVEVDMTSQKLYFYSEGECLIDTDIVTGNTKRRMGTPEGVYYVYSKQRNRTLRGPGYASPVKYWMPVYKNIGLHDARWRSEFGGEIYKTNGSHGCINLPLEKAAELYDLVEIGMPVVVFY